MEGLINDSEKRPPQIQYGTIPSEKGDYKPSDSEEEEMLEKKLNLGIDTEACIKRLGELFLKRVLCDIVWQASSGREGDWFECGPRVENKNVEHWDNPVDNAQPTFGKSGRDNKNLGDGRGSNDKVNYDGEPDKQIESVRAKNEKEANKK